MIKKGNYKERSGEAIRKIVSNQNSKNEMIIAKNIIEKALNDIKDSSQLEAHLEMVEKTTGIIVIYLVVQNDRTYKIHCYDLCTRDLTEITPAYVKQEITRKLEIVAIGTL